ncbi:hypothetical protein [Actinomyces gerencseriae]|uniref:hypothetical protein n=1 Tax=Actinomyces gerencseriae TaxID=52769 RepID=UPI0012EC55D5|nr:hypothetical protein [Actinomyces gerencseriae]
MKADVIVSHLDPRGTIVDRLILRGIRHETYSWAVCEYDPIDRVADLVDGGVVGLCEEPDMSVMLELSADL